ncbi:MAG: N-terminal domain of ribose phosphate pyrophosphokinae [Verrucomicrobiales bacterium]|nr:N-terminal domain of ribose phosphate pyrophosphokinae [Verrucomicrobiales bacterium]
MTENVLLLLQIVDACRRGAAARITAIVPDFGYGSLTNFLNQTTRENDISLPELRILRTTITLTIQWAVRMIILHGTTLEGVRLTRLFPI